jgi:hypothetical protein
MNKPNHLLPPEVVVVVVATAEAVVVAMAEPMVKEPILLRLRLIPLQPQRLKPNLKPRLILLVEPEVVVVAVVVVVVAEAVVVAAPRTGFFSPFSLSPLNSILSLVPIASQRRQQRSFTNSHSRKVLRRCSQSS